MKILSKENIKVNTGLLKKEAQILYEPYFINRIKKLPYITGKIAVSNNNVIYSKGTKRITDEISDRLTHYLRYKNDAILVSSKTINIDNPKLNCRISGLKKYSPQRIILDQNLKIKRNTYIFKTVKKNNTIIFHNSTNKLKIKVLRRAGITLINLKTDNKKLFNLKELLKKIYNLGVRSLIVEGGDKITKSFLQNRHFNQFYMFKSPKRLSKAVTHQEFTSSNILLKKYQNKSNLNSKLAKDSVTIYKR